MKAFDSTGSSKAFSMAAFGSLSVVTPLLNRVDVLAVALESVASQGVKALEHIVVDGGSDDGAPDLARQSGAHVIHAPGASIYEALNIGLTHAQGEYICLLNSDDRFAPDAFQKALSVLDANPRLELLRGRAPQEQLRGGQWRMVDPPAPALTLRQVLLAPPNINACFFRRRLLDRVGPFETRYRISADRVWLSRVLRSGADIATLDEALYVYRNHAASLTIGANKPARMAWVKEHLSYAREALASSLTPTEEVDFKAFWGRETAHLITLHVGRRDWSGALEALSQGFGVDALWPCHAAAPLVGIASRRLGRLPATKAG